MTVYVKEGVTKHISELRQMYPNTSIPDGGSMEHEGWFHLIPSAPPEPLPGYQVVAGVPVNNTQTWEQVPIEQSVPQQVSMRQARLALLQSGLLATIDAAIAQGSEADKIQWEYATEVNRNDTLVINLTTALNLTEQQLDDLFTLASSL